MGGEMTERKTLRVSQVYKKEEPFLCGNLDCQAPLEKPFSASEIVLKRGGKRYVTRFLLCESCVESFANGDLVDLKVE
jgi:hypothetical protein